MGKQKNRVTKWSPVNPMDFPRFESWLEEMAGKGFLVHRVQQNLFSLARVKFRREGENWDVVALEGDRVLALRYGGTLDLTEWYGDIAAMLMPEA